MKRSRFVLMALAALLPISTAAVAQAPATIILVRHAEKGGEAGDRDPELTDAGRDRAMALARTVGDAGITTIYSTPFLRTRNTAAPLARRLGIEISVTPITRTFTEDMVATLRTHMGETVLVVGHSNTVPGLITALGAGPLEDLRDDEYSWLFVVTLEPGGEASLVKLRYGS
jgi:broad specificity phosphatase PhoE